MAERRLPCGKCGATILVPDQYPYASIACAYCGTVVDARSRTRQPDYAPYPQQPAYFPLPPGTSPSAGQYPFEYAPPVVKKSGGGRGWIVALIVTAVVLLAGGVVASLFGGRPY